MSRWERGAGSVLALAVVVVVSTATWAVLVLALGIRARHQAAAAADLAALAAAGAVSGSCPRAAAVAQANGAELVRCVRLAGESLVAVRVELPPLAAALPAPQREARAGVAVR